MTTLSRRGVLGAFIGVPLVPTVAHAFLTSPPPVLTEPQPTRVDFEECSWCPCDVSLCAVGQALDRLQWVPTLAPKPLLCVHPFYYVGACDIREQYRGALEVWTTRDFGCADTWFVAWRGRRVGSVGG